MRGAGCTFNHLIDRDVDAKVALTVAGRCLPARSAPPLPSCSCSALGVAALLILVQFNTFSIVLGLASAAPVAVYPFMKRITYWPQLFLGIAFNRGRSRLGRGAGPAALPPIPL